MAERSDAERSEDGGAASTSNPPENEQLTMDITARLESACNVTGEGELIHGDDLDLSPTVSALKDQNLDPNFVATPYSTDEAIIDDAAPVPLSTDRTLDIQRVIDVMDHYLTCEAAWHCGLSLKETVFSCVYVWDPPSRLSSNVLLHSFCGVSWMTCNDVSQVLLIDEEFLNAKGDGAILSKLQKVDEDISRQLKACKAPLSKKSIFKDVEPLQTNPDLEEEFCKAVLCRLRFRKHFYHMLTCLRKREGKGFELAKKHIDSCLSELQSMLISEKFLKSQSTVSTNRVEYNKTTASGCQPVGFDYLSRKLCSWKEAVGCFQKLLRDLKIMCSISLSPVLEDAVRFLVDFQKFQPLRFARAYIQLLVVQNGRLYGREPIFVIICKAALLPKRANDHNIQKLKTVEELGTLLIKLLRALCTDIDSQRLELASILRDWRRILPQLFKDFIREYGDPKRFSSDQNKLNLKMRKHILAWASEQRHWIALRYLLLGFELKQYSIIDFCMTYWYIYVLLIKLVEQIEHKTSLKNESIIQKARMKRGLAKDVDKEYEVPPQVLLLKCYAYVAEGLILILGLLRTKFEIFSRVDPDNEEQRFNLTFSTLLGGGGYLSEAPYNEFKKAVSKSRFSKKFQSFHVNREDSFDKAQRIVKQLKGKFSKDPVRLAELDQLEAVAVRNTGTFDILRMVDGLDEFRSVAFELKTHPHFAVASLISRSP